MKIRDITQFLEKIAPPQYQEGYDNAGLIVGDPMAEVTGALVCLDSIESIVEEAIERGCNLIVAHHPIVFKGLKRFTGKNYVERTVMKAIKNDIAIYAIHTNLDSVLRQGVNTRICERLGLVNCRILAPKRQTLMKLTTFVPIEDTQRVLDALYAAGAGQIGNYKNCSFRTEGVGTFRPTGAANPTIGVLDKDEEVREHRIEVIFEQFLEGKVLTALRQAHLYEDVAYYLHSLENENTEVGSGMIGDIGSDTERGAELDFLQFLKEKMQVSCVKYTALLGKKVKKVAVCGGSGGFLLNHAIGAGADVFITADYKYHEFFDADGKIVIADIGHFESEQFTIDLLSEVLQKEFEKINVFSTKKITNPVNYL
ncbi:MAG: Nif3-like dinuclear metal center hexameric protein [Saprospiraceae bacterium]|nr:Nif3-like dinuclear metal center hexameric protein [Saprospiraceae bacterium]